MKKIGIITYHFARNYGAVLQCFALQTYLENNGHKVEIINYVTEQQRNNNDYYKHGKSIKSIVVNTLLIPFMKMRKIKNQRFDQFNNDYLNLTTIINDLESLKKHIDSNNYDLIISGSDQVFNPNIEDFDKAFVLPFHIEAKKIAYAASTGNAKKEDLDKISKEIRDFNKISIREEKDIKKFEDFNIDISITPDPVLLLDSDDWSKFTNEKKEKDYLLCYFLHKDLFKKEFEIAKKIAKEKNLKIKIINARYSRESFKKGTIYDAGPIEFVNLIKNSSYVCTDSFHGTLFSIIFDKDFKCFDSRKNKNDSRRQNLLYLLNAKENLQYIEDYYQPNKVYKKKNKELIKKEKNKAKEFFGDVL